MKKIHSERKFKQYVCSSCTLCTNNNRKAVRFCYSMYVKSPDNFLSKIVELLSDDEDLVQGIWNESGSFPHFDKIFCSNMSCLKKRIGNIYCEDISTCMTKFEKSHDITYKRAQDNTKHYITTESKNKRNRYIGFTPEQKKPTEPVFFTNNNLEWTKEIQGILNGTNNI